MSLKQRTFGVCLAVALTLGLPRAAAAAPVGLELLLLVDVSLSVVDAEYALQKQGGLMIVANSLDDFSEAVTTKIGREITAIPEPGTLVLLGTGALLVARRWKAAR